MSSYDVFFFSNWGPHWSRLLTDIHSFLQVQENTWRQIFGKAKSWGYFKPWTIPLGKKIYCTQNKSAANKTKRASKRSSVLPDPRRHFCCFSVFKWKQQRHQMKETATESSFLSANHNTSVWRKKQGLVLSYSALWRWVRAGTDCTVWSMAYEHHNGEDCEGQAIKQTQI